jgi:DtxR family Mn-dependent transcriptional regulator
MVHRLREEGFIEVRGRSLSLTGPGRDLATSVIRKHRLAERLLTDVIGLPWHKVHAEADRWEHVISDEVEARLADILGNPATCPHGNPIPGSGVPPEPATVLAKAKVGDRVRLSRMMELVEFDLGALVYLEQHGFIPGCVATVGARGPDGSLVLQVGDTTLVLGASLAALLFVAPAGPPGPSGVVATAGTGPSADGTGPPAAVAGKGQARRPAKAAPTGAAPPPAP